MHLIHSKPASDWLQNAIDTGVTIQVPMTRLEMHELCTNLEPKQQIRIKGLYNALVVFVSYNSEYGEITVLYRDQRQKIIDLDNLTKITLVQ